MNEQAMQATSRKSGMQLLALLLGAISLTSAWVWFYFGRDEQFRYLHPRTTVAATFIPPALLTMIWIVVSGYRDASSRLPVLSAARRGVVIAVILGAIFSMPLLERWAWPALWGVITGAPSIQDLSDLAASVLIIVITYTVIGGAVGGVAGIVRDFFPRWRVLPNRSRN